MISIVIPVFNEEHNVAGLYQRVRAAAETWGDDYQVIVVDDGSQDATVELLRGIHGRDPRWQVLCLSRNFGHQTAISAGIFYSRGDAVAIMDGDLQDPPEVLFELLSKWREGYQVVYAIRRRRKEHLLKRIAYKLFYRIFRRMASIDVPMDAGDFCVMDRAVVEVLRSMPERTRFVRGLRSWSGFRQTGVEFERHARQNGQPKYTLRKLFQLATNGIVCFSSRPLRMASWIGVAMCGTAIGMIALLFVWWYSNRSLLGVHPSDSVGWTSITSLLLFLFGMQMLMLGVIGEYLARVFDEVKQRPPWIVSQALGFDGLEHRSIPTWGLFLPTNADAAHEKLDQAVEAPTAEVADRV